MKKICLLLVNSNSYEAYLLIDSTLQRGLLISNEYAEPNGEKNEKDVIKALTEQEKELGQDEELRQLFQSKLKRLAEFGCLEPRNPAHPPSSPVAADYTASLSMWRIYMAERKLKCLENFETALLKTDENLLPDPGMVFNAIIDESDLALERLMMLMGAVAGQQADQEQPPVAGGASYSDFKKELSDVSAQLEETAKNITGTADKDKINAYCISYGELTKKQEALKYLAEQQKAKASCT